MACPSPSNQKFYTMTHWWFSQVSRHLVLESYDFSSTQLVPTVCEHPGSSGVLGLLPLHRDRGKSKPATRYLTNLKEDCIHQRLIISHVFMCLISKGRKETRLAMPFVQESWQTTCWPDDFLLFIHPASFPSDDMYTQTVHPGHHTVFFPQKVVPIRGLHNVM